MSLDNEVFDDAFWANTYQQASLNLNGARIDLTIDSDDEEANRFPGKHTAPLIDITDTSDDEGPSSLMEGENRENRVKRESRNTAGTETLRGQFSWAEDIDEVPFVEKNDGRLPRTEDELHIMGKSGRFSWAKDNAGSSISSTMVCSLRKRRCSEPEQEGKSAPSSDKTTLKQRRRSKEATQHREVIETDGGAGGGGKILKERADPEERAKKRGSRTRCSLPVITPPPSITSAARPRRRPRVIGPGVRASAFQRTLTVEKKSDFLIRPYNFHRFLRDIARDIARESGQKPIRFYREALDAFQQAAEAFAIELFQEAKLLANHAERSTVMKKDIKHANRIIHRQIISHLSLCNFVRFD